MHQNKVTATVYYCFLKLLGTTALETFELIKSLRSEAAHINMKLCIRVSIGLFYIRSVACGVVRT